MLLSWCSTRGFAHTEGTERAVSGAGRSAAGAWRRCRARRGLPAEAAHSRAGLPAGPPAEASGQTGVGRPPTGQAPPPEKGPRSPQPHLVPARQEEVHGSPVDAVPLAEPGQHVLDGEPGPDQHHAGRPIRQLDAAVLGRLVPLGCEGPAGLWLGAGRHGGGHRAGCSGRAGAACACGQGSRAPPVHTQLQHTRTRPVLTNAHYVPGPPADTGGSQHLSQPRAPARQANPPTSGSNSHKG